MNRTYANRNITVVDEGTMICKGGKFWSQDSKSFGPKSLGTIFSDVMKAMQECGKNKIGGCRFMTVTSRVQS